MARRAVPHLVLALSVLLSPMTPGLAADGPRISFDLRLRAYSRLCNGYIAEFRQHLRSSHAILASTGGSAADFKNPVCATSASHPFVKAMRSDLPHLEQQLRTLGVAAFVAEKRAQSRKFMTGETHAQYHSSAPWSYNDIQLTVSMIELLAGIESSADAIVK